MRRNIPSLSALQSFSSVAKHESITLAANELSLTAGAVSRQISLLENQLGIVLFNRIRQRVTLTRAGNVYSGHIAHILDKLERETLEIMAHEGEGGVVEIAVLPTVGSQWLIPRLTDFNRKHPDITVNLHTRTTRFLFNETVIDGALYFGANFWPGAKTDYLFDEVLLPVGSPQVFGEERNYSAEEIAAQPLLHLMTRPEAWRAWSAATGVTNVNIMRGPRFEVQSMLIAAVCAGQGVALLPRFLIDEPLRNHGMRILSEQSVRSPGAYYFACPEQKSNEVSLVKFRSWLLGSSGLSR